MRKTIGVITQIGEEIPFSYTFFKENYSNASSPNDCLSAKLVDEHYVLTHQFSHTNLVFGVSCGTNKKQADKRLYEKALWLARGCDEIEDNTHYSKKKQTIR